jgi:hypothetical protein
VQFIELCNIQECFWKFKWKDCGNWTKKNAVHKTLIYKMKELDEDAGRTVIVNKINNLIITFQKELKRVVELK